MTCRCTAPLANITTFAHLFTLATGASLAFFATSAAAEETFVTIHGVNGRYLQVTRSSSEETSRRGRGGSPSQPGQSAPSMRGGRGRFGGGGGAGGRGRGRGQPSDRSTVRPTTVLVPATAKVTTAMRERRTFEFRVLGEIAGGLRNPIFTRLKEPVSARIVSTNNVITEVNVITGDTDINQTATSSRGESMIAVKPKRPPHKRRQP